MQYELAESREFLGTWHVEAVGDDGEVYVAVFSGPRARERAAEYADWKNGVRSPAALLKMVSR
jgi:hypothetical protein